MKQFRDQQIASVFINHDCEIDLFTVDVARRSISFFVHGAYLVNGQLRHLGAGHIAIDGWESASTKAQYGRTPLAPAEMESLSTVDSESVTVEELLYSEEKLKLEFTHYIYLGESAKPSQEHVYAVVELTQPSVTATFSEDSSCSFNTFLFTICRDLELPRTIEYGELFCTIETVPRKILYGDASEEDRQMFEISRAICRLALENDWLKRWREYFELEFVMDIAERLLRQPDSGAK